VGGLPEYKIIESINVNCKMPSQVEEGLTECKFSPKTAFYFLVVYKNNRQSSKIKFSGSN